MSDVLTASGWGTTTQRKSDRIRYSYTLTIAGKDSSGYDFEENAHTEVITRDGGLIVSPLSLTTGSSLTMRRNGREVVARIVGQVGLREEAYLYGVQFTEAPEDPFWDVNFPPATAESSVGRVVLQCSPCGRQELMHLSEIEVMVFENMRVIPRKCERCKIETLWLEPLLLGDSGVVIGNEAYQHHGVPMAAQRPRTVNDRKHSRISMKNVKACLHRAGFAEDVVTVLDLSRGGIRFVSLVDYVPGTRVEVAVPYTEGGANVFTPGKIARVRCRPTADIPGEFGLEYVK
jgi:hypothetical protein